jgi:ribosome-associated protein
MIQTLCGTCFHAREIISGTGSRFLLCQKSQEDRRYPKYPPQSVFRCDGFERTKDEPMAATEEDIESKPDALRLDQFLKLSGISETGGQSKVMIQSVEIKVNGEVETRRRRKLSVGDVVEVGDHRFEVH